MIRYVLCSSISDAANLWQISDLPEREHAIYHVKSRMVRNEPQVAGRKSSTLRRITSRGVVASFRGKISAQTDNTNNDSNIYHRTR